MTQLAVACLSRELPRVTPMEATSPPTTPTEFAMAVTIADGAGLQMTLTGGTQPRQYSDANPPTSTTLTTQTQCVAHHTTSSAVLIAAPASGLGPVLTPPSGALLMPLADALPLRSKRSSGVSLVTALSMVAVAALVNWTSAAGLGKPQTATTATPPPADAETGGEPPPT